MQCFRKLPVLTQGDCLRHPGMSRQHISVAVAWVGYGDLRTQRCA